MKRSATPEGLSAIFAFFAVKYAEEANDPTAINTKHRNGKPFRYDGKQEFEGSEREALRYTGNLLCDLCVPCG